VCISVEYEAAVFSGPSLGGVSIDANILPHFKHAPQIVKNTPDAIAYRALHVANSHASQELARLRSIACLTAGAFLNTVTKSNWPSLANGEFIDS
jgi:hypothetical protein